MPVLIPVAPQRDTDTTQERELIPDKTVLSGTIDEVQIRQNNAGDGYYLNIKVVTSDGGPYPRRWIYDIVSLKEKARWKVDQLMHAVGASDNDLSVPVCFYDASLEDPPEFDTDSPIFVIDVNALLGEYVDFEVTIDAYKDKTGQPRQKNAIKKFLPRRDAVVPVDDMDLPF